MVNGETVYSMLAVVQDSTPKAFVTPYEVIDAAHGVGRGPGGVKVFSPWESIHASEPEAWEAAARELLAVAEAARQKAQECLQRAAQAAIVQVTA